MKAKIGRNDPCPCGSGKKFKNCCLERFRSERYFAVRPAVAPEPIDHHLTSSNGGKTWQKRPGLLAARIGYELPENLDSDVEQLFKEATDRMLSSMPSDMRSKLTEDLSNCRHKLYAVRYHFRNYAVAEQEKVKSFGKDYSAWTGVGATESDPRLIYETEAFLFQVKSSLDVLVKCLEPLFGIRLTTFGNEGEDIIKALQNNCPKVTKSTCESLIRVVRENQAWVRELVNMRDQVTHYSSLKGFNCFIEEPYRGGDHVVIHYPTMPNGQRASDYLDLTWNRLLSLHEQFMLKLIRSTQ